jgi:hypothetical protein
VDDGASGIDELDEVELAKRSLACARDHEADGGEAKQHGSAPERDERHESSFSAPAVDAPGRRNGSEVLWRIPGGRGEIPVGEGSNAMVDGGIRAVNRSLLVLVQPVERGGMNRS